jgi:type I restriction enzyme R subunit
MQASMLEAGLETLVLGELTSLGWTAVHGPDIAPGEALAERQDYREVVLTRPLRHAVIRLNAGLPSGAVDEVIKTVLRPESQVVMTENWRAYEMLINGVPVEYREADGGIRHARAWLVDWTNPDNNEWTAVNQFTVTGKTDRRPDVVLFVNGLPLGLMELKRPGKPNATLRGAFNQVKTYRNQIPDVFTWNQVVVISDGVAARAGTFSAGWEHYAPWKTVGGDLADPDVPQIETLVRGMLDRARFLDLIRNFVVFSDDKIGVVKKIAKYHQFWAVNKAIDRTVEAADYDGRAGVVWHTQGSGKSLEMHCYAGKILRHPFMENPTLVVLTDRNDLDDQLFAEVFASSRPGAPLPEIPVQAETRQHLKDLLDNRQSGGIIFTTIQKFGLSKEDREAGRRFPTLSERNNIVVMVDEAHRSNYDFVDGFARHLRDGLPNATYIGFTGTPIESSDKNTRQVFGEYIDVYDLTQAVADGATVKVFYEPRLAKVDLPEEARDEIDSEFAAAVSGAEDDAKERLKSRWARVEAIVGSEKRVRSLAKDIVEHWEARRDTLAGKAMVVAMSRRIAVALYNEIVALRPDWHSEDDDLGQIKVIITGSADDDEELQPHIRNKDALRDLKSRAKNPSDLLELVIVRDMWLTGFDSPSMHTMYVDKPMQGAPLMQAIARVNRTFKDKPSGLVVDYLGIAEDLKKALADYTDRDKDNQELGQDLREKAIPGLIEKHDIVCTILHGHNWREQLTAGGDKAFLKALTSTMNYLIADHIQRGEGNEAENPCTKDNPCLKHRFMDQTRRLVSLFAMCVPAEEALKIRDDVAFFDAVRGQISKTEGSDREGGDPGAELETAIKQIVSEAMSGTGVIDIYEEAGLAKPDISLIDDEFVKNFPKSKNQNLQIEVLKRLLADEIGKISRRNVVVGKQFSEMLQQSLLRYQNRTLDSATVMAELADLAARLREEHDRGAKTGLNPDELAFYDAISANGSAVALGEDTLKAIAHELVEIVRRDAKTDWNVKEQVRAKLRTTIKRLLRKYGYPPDKANTATDLVLQQAEVLATIGLEDAEYV